MSAETDLYYAVLPGKQERRTLIGTRAEIPGVSTLLSGQVIGVPVPTPLAYALSPEMPGDRQHFYRNVPLMSNRLVALLRECGVDNLQTFAATLRDPVTGLLWDDYQAVNI